METLRKGTIEHVVVTVADRLQNLTDLTDKNPTFKTRIQFDESDDPWVDDGVSATVFDEMSALCLIDTTQDGYVADQTYELFLTINNISPETPLLGPFLFAIED